MSYYDYPPGLEPDPPHDCCICERSLPGLDWDHYDYHLLAKHLEEMVTRWGPGNGYDDVNLSNYKTLLVAKKQRLQLALNL